MEVCKVEDWHIQSVARRMRKADREEVFASSGKLPVEALYFSTGKSSGCWTVMFDGQPEIIFGVGSINVLGQTGAPWALGTDEVRKNYVNFLKASVDFRDQLLARYPTLRNIVDVRNTSSIRWLTWLGFTFSQPFDLNGYKFRMFELRSPHV